MDEIIEYKSYSEYKATLDAELKTNVESFMKIGYLLKVARDTEILNESGYKNVADFAQAEYGLTKDIVSRYIAINDRYSEGGYSERLKTEFEGYGVAKLSEMLTLPDSIIAEIEPTLTRKEIQDIKREIAEEEKITPMEVMMEEKEVTELTLPQQCWKEYFKGDKERFLAVGKAIGLPVLNPGEKIIEAMIDALAPSGMQILWARISGVGKIMIAVKGKEEPITFTNSRDGSKEERTALETYNDLADIFDRMNEDTYDDIYEIESKSNDIIENVTETAEIIGMSEPIEEPSEKPEKAAAEEPSEEPSEKPSEEPTEEPSEEQTEAAVEETEEPSEEPNEAADGFMKLNEIDRIWFNLNTELSILNTKAKGKFTKSCYATVGVIKQYLEKIMELES